MDRRISPWTVRGLYLVAAILAVIPLVEMYSSTWPLQPTDLMWRYGALGLNANLVPNITVGMAALMGMAYWQGHGVAFRAFGYICVFAALLVLPTMAMFALDLSTVRALREEEMRSGVLLSGSIQEAKYLVSGVALALLGIGAIGTRIDRSERPVPSPASLRGGG